LVKENPENYRFVFLIDSIDALIPRGDFEGGTEKAVKVAGGALLSADFLRRMALAISTKKHLVILISQVRSKIKINQYEASEYEVTNASGGHALLHYSDWIFQFEGRHQADTIFADENNKKSDRIGHFCKILFKKSANEKTGFLVRYPIKYGRENGQSIWIERELVDVMEGYGASERKGAWITLETDFWKTMCEKLKREVPQQFNGVNKLRDYLEENQDVTQYAFREIKNLEKRLQEE